MPILPTCRTAAAAFFAIATAAALPRAQDVLLSEVRADGEQRWVELHNRGATPVDLSTWSLHHASQTTGTSHDHWWAFPAGTVMAPDSYLRVHWFQAAPPGATVPGELWTGATPFHFLFGLGGEALEGARGAFGLLSSQVNELMNSPSIFEDWVSWGEHGFAREPLAIQAGLWAAGRCAPAIPAGSSLARDPAATSTVPFPDLAWFVDNTPTPLQPNITGAIVQAYGTACVLPGNHLLGAPVLRATGQPLLGNAGFGLAIDHTTGIFGEFTLFAFAAAAAPPGQPSLLPPFGGVSCAQAIDALQWLGAWLAPAQIVTTPMPLSLAGLPPSALGAELHVQAIVLDLLPYAMPPYQGISNALRVVVGQ